MPSKKRATPISLQPLDGMQIKKEDYKLVYVGELSGNMSLDDIFEKFNIDRPEDFRGHSLSVSDIIVLNDGEKVTAHFVDSISFEQLDSFLNLEEQVLSELAYEVGETQKFLLYQQNTCVDLMDHEIYSSQNHHRQVTDSLGIFCYMLSAHEIYEINVPWYLVLICFSAL